MVIQTKIFQTLKNNDILYRKSDAIDINKLMLEYVQSHSKISYKLYGVVNAM